MATVTKAIKPARLKEDAFRLAMLNAMRKFGTELKAEYDACTATWEHKPKFVAMISLSGGQFTVIVDTDDVIFRYVEKGTKPHAIFAGIYTGKSDKKALAFTPGSTPKTTPGVIGSGAGGKGGGKKTVTPYVWHPGTKPRNFAAVIAKKMAPRFKAHMQDAMREFARNSGHYMGG